MAGPRMVCHSKALGCRVKNGSSSKAAIATETEAGEWITAAKDFQMNYGR